MELKTPNVSGCASVGLLKMKKHRQEQKQTFPKLCIVPKFFIFYKLPARFIWALNLCLDDYALFCRGQNGDDVTLTLEVEAAKVSRWASYNRFTFNTLKLEREFFSINTVESRKSLWKTSGLWRTPHLLFWGTTYKQQKFLTLELKQRASLLWRLTGTFWW